MQSRRRKCDHDVARVDFVLVEYRLSRYDADSKTCKVVFVFRIESRHLSCLAADQSCKGLNASVCNAFYDVCYLFRLVLSACNVIQKEQRPCACADDIVHAHGDTVDPDRVMLVHEKCDLQLGPDAVCPAHEHRVVDILFIKAVQSAESAYISCITKDKRLLYMFLHKLDGFIPFGDIYACVFIAAAETVIHYAVSYLLNSSSISLFFSSTAWAPSFRI